MNDMHNIQHLKLAIQRAEPWMRELNRDTFMEGAPDVMVRALIMQTIKMMGPPGSPMRAAMMDLMKVVDNGYAAQQMMKD
jgi:hypothetical protein